MIGKKNNLRVRQFLHIGRLFSVFDFADALNQLIADTRYNNAWKSVEQGEANQISVANREINCISSVLNVKKKNIHC